jgi:hypothetical protein
MEIVEPTMTSSEVFGMYSYTLLFCTPVTEKQYRQRLYGLQATASGKLILGCDTAVIDPSLCS